VKSVGSDTFTLTTHDGTTVTVDVSSSTTYVDPSATSATFSTIKVGDHVAVFGTDTSNTVTATKVAIGDAGGFGGPGGGWGGHGAPGGTPPAAFGTVKSVGSDTFTLTTHDGTTVTVDVSSSTTYREAGKSSASLSDVTVGSQVVVFGTDTSDTVTATSVGIGAP
jgi:preprotein translocase subunit YajC